MENACKKWGTTRFLCYFESISISSKRFLLKKFVLQKWHVSFVSFYGRSSLIYWTIDQFYKTLNSHLYLGTQLKCNNNFSDPITRSLITTHRHHNRPSLSHSFAAIHPSLPVPFGFRPIAFIPRHFNFLGPFFFRRDSFSSPARDIAPFPIPHLIPSASPSGSRKPHFYISLLFLFLWFHISLIASPFFPSPAISRCLRPSREFPFRWPRWFSLTPPPPWHAHASPIQARHTHPPVLHEAAWPTSNVPTATTYTCLRQARE